MTRGLPALVLIAALCGCQAKSGAPDPAVGFNPKISEFLVTDLSSRVLDMMPRLQCGDRPCAPATEEERRTGMIPREEARAIIRLGLLSQLRECAGRDWQAEGFAPLMADWRKVRKAPVRQLAFVGALHGAGMGAAKQTMGGSCPNHKG